MNITDSKEVLAMDPKAFMQLLLARRSTFPRQYSGERIENSVIKELLEFAHTAPNHKKTMPWRFIVFSDQAKTKLLEFKKAFYLANTPQDKIKQSKVNAFEERKQQVSHIIAISASLDSKFALPEWEELSAVSCAAQNIYLGLAPLGLAGYWSTGGIVNSEKLRHYLGLEQNERFMGFFYLGKPAVEIPKSNREPLGDRVKWINE